MNESAQNMECERKFLVTGDGWLQGVMRLALITQSYLVNDDTKCVRIRSWEEGDKTECYLTIKSCEPGSTRTEVEVPISVDQYRALDALADKGTIIKRRFIVQNLGDEWEIDVFDDGLVIAEIEFVNEGSSEMFVTPDWLGKEVTDNKAYYNAEIAKMKYPKP
jgi:adenylate cyclase